MIKPSFILRINEIVASFHAVLNGRIVPGNCRKKRKEALVIAQQKKRIFQQKKKKIETAKEKPLGRRNRRIDLEKIEIEH